MGMHSVGKSFIVVVNDRWELSISPNFGDLKEVKQYIRKRDYDLCDVEVYEISKEINIFDLMRDPNV